MNTDKLDRITRRVYLLELALAGLEEHAEGSSPADPEQHYAPVRELAEEIYFELHDELDAARDVDKGLVRVVSARRRGGP